MSAMPLSGAMRPTKPTTDPSGGSPNRARAARRSCGVRGWKRETSIPPKPPSPRTVIFSAEVRRSRSTSARLEAEIATISVEHFIATHSSTQSSDRPGPRAPSSLSPKRM